MNPKLQRIAIAEACGWSMYHPTKKTRNEGRANYPHWISPPPPEFSDEGLDYPPDYLNDLNAMHEAEKVILDKDDGTWGVYVYELGEIGRTSVLPRIHTTAAQRAEAFLRTIGKWEETQP